MCSFIFAGSLALLSVQSLLAQASETSCPADLALIQKGVHKKHHMARFSGTKEPKEPTFGDWDADGDGKVTEDEVRALCGKMGFPADQVVANLKKSDIDGDGFATQREYDAWHKSVKAAAAKAKAGAAGKGKAMPAQGAKAPNATAPNATEAAAWKKAMAASKGHGKVMRPHDPKASNATDDAAAQEKAIAAERARREQEHAKAIEEQQGAIAAERARREQEHAKAQEEADKSPRGRSQVARDKKVADAARANARARAEAEASAAPIVPAKF